MPISFNRILLGYGYKLNEVRFLRHKDTRADKGKSPYELWRDNRPAFELYQTVQGIPGGRQLRVKYWASFVGTPDKRTLFVGLYKVEYLGLLKEDVPRPHREGIDERMTCLKFKLTPEKAFADLDGRLFIDWGKGMRKWVQRADKQAKVVTEIHTAFREPEFPGFLHFIQPLSRLDSLPASWIAVLKASRGIYLLTCPLTKEQYVGSATGSEAFWNRWQSYFRTGHGGNVALKSRDPSDYQVSILEVAGTAATTEEILRMEQQWKAKLQSREMGLNKN